tara:strand:+ start:401 stop:571 length:171 start_codon:yes stop_codon:yes gene_type:complete
MVMPVLRKCETPSSANSVGHIEMSHFPASSMRKIALENGCEHLKRDMQMLALATWM